VPPRQPGAADLFSGRRETPSPLRTHAGEERDPTLALGPTEGGRSIPPEPAPAPERTLEFTPPGQAGQTHHPAAAGPGTLAAPNSHPGLAPTLDPEAIPEPAPEPTMDPGPALAEGRAAPPTRTPRGRMTRGGADDVGFSLSAEAQGDLLAHRR